MIASSMRKMRLAWILVATCALIISCSSAPKKPEISRQLITHKRYVDDSHPQQMVVNMQLERTPNDVIKVAKKQLCKLEQNSAAQNPQGDLFDRKPEMPEPEEHQLLVVLRGVQPDELSPKEALEKLYQLRKLV